MLKVLPKPNGAAGEGTGLCVRRGSPANVAIELAQRAALVVCDRGYLRPQRQWYSAGGRQSRDVEFYRSKAMSSFRSNRSRQRPRLAREHFVQSCCGSTKNWLRRTPTILTGMRRCARCSSPDICKITCACIGERKSWSGRRHPKRAIRHCFASITRSSLMAAMLIPTPMSDGLSDYMTGRGRSGRSLARCGQ